MEKIKIKSTKNADTRTSTDNVTKEILLDESKKHIQAVMDLSNFIADRLVNQCKYHDHTKIEYIGEFYADFTSRKVGAEFKQLNWWQKHKTERHHLNDSVPEDVNLIDVLEMVIDCTVAGLARSGDVYDIKINSDVLNKAIENTKNLIINNVEVEK